MTTNKLVHKNPKAEEAVLAEEAKAYLAKQPALQFILALLTILRDLKLPWWTPTQRRVAYPEGQRMLDLKDRRIVSVRIIQALTGALPNAALMMEPEFAAKNISLALVKDRSDEDFENAFEPEELVLYGDAGQFYADFREVMPWEHNSPEHKDLAVRLIESILKIGILSHHAVFSAIPSDIRQAKMPGVQTQIIDALLKQEKESPDDPYRAVDIMSIATPRIIVDSTDLIDMKGIFEAAEKAMGFEVPEVPSEKELDEKSDSSPKA